MKTEKNLIIALAGNPNSGKTTVFNGLTGAKQKVGNFPGVTVEKRTGRTNYKGYNITFVDLPGTYSLTAQSLDEKVARDFILNETPDIIVNVIDSGSLERSLYLTNRLIAMGVDVIIDLNMWDEVEKSGTEIDVEKLSNLLRMPVLTTVATKEQGLTEILATAIQLYEDKDKKHHPSPISYGSLVDDIIQDIYDELCNEENSQSCCNCRWLAVKLLEGDEEITERYIPGAGRSESLKSKLEKSVKHIKATTGQSPDIAIDEGRCGYVAGITREVIKKPPLNRMKLSRQVDVFLTHKIIGYPIFILVMWCIFQATFKLGAYPMDWIDAGVIWLQNLVTAYVPAAGTTDFITEGIIGGVGAVIIFLPNIVILFLGISLLEDSGYMARVAFLTDKPMHFLGLHGKSFIPMLMGFGCSVPAIMATRTLESNRDRTLTALLLPMISCSAKLPVYILFAGAFFGEYAGNVVFIIYVLGILLAVLVARVLQRTILRSDSIPFVMELPPYRLPTFKSVVIHMWERTKIYLQKMGGIILIGSVILWMLGYFPRKKEYAENYELQIEQLSILHADQASEKIKELEQKKAAEDLDYSFIGRFGKLLEPVVKPLGFNWQMGVALVTGFVAKEVVVSTLGVLYQLGDDVDEESANLAKLLSSPGSGISKLTAFAFLVFVLIYTACIAAVVAIKRELGIKWMWFSIAFQTILAWIAAFVVYQGGRVSGL